MASTPAHGPVALVTLRYSFFFLFFFVSFSDHCEQIGGNYALTIAPAKEASDAGFSQILWLFNDHCTEVGTMNFFVYWINEHGEKELVTAPLDGCILPGVTRDSILGIAKQWKDIKVSERTYTMTEVAKAINEGRVCSCFFLKKTQQITSLNSFSHPLFFFLLLAS